MNKEEKLENKRKLLEGRLHYERIHGYIQVVIFIKLYFRVTPIRNQSKHILCSIYSLLKLNLEIIRYQQEIGFQFMIYKYKSTRLFLWVVITLSIVSLTSDLQY